VSESNPMDAAEIAVDITRGAPTPEELAALIAVVTEAYAVEAATAVVDDEPARSAWSYSQRGLREPLQRERGWVRG
jgi:phenylpyruvate tautomerase PptA (4-oxalocrotonate tautomerase family)